MAEIRHNLGSGHLILGVGQENLVSDSNYNPPPRCACEKIQPPRARKIKFTPPPLSSYFYIPKSIVFPENSLFIAFIIKKCLPVTPHPSGSDKNSFPFLGPKNIPPPTVLNSCSLILRDSDNCDRGAHCSQVLYILCKIYAKSKNFYFTPKA